MNSIEAKLNRTDEQLTALEREVIEFENKIPPPQLTKGFRPGTSIYAFRAQGHVDVPLRFAVLAGEIVHQLRSSLDHLVAALVQAQGKPVTRSHQFPICRTPDQFQACLKKGYLSGVSVEIRDLIRGYQPFLSTNPSTSELLGLQELNNADKHRLLVVVAAAAQIGEEVRFNCREDATVTGMAPPYPNLMDGSEFFSIDFLAPYPTADAEIDVRTLLALQRPTELDWPFPCAPLISTLTQCRRAVGLVVARCAELKKA